MSNDLIFSILPRNTKVPVESDNRVKKVVRTEHAEKLNQDEKAQHEEVHIVDEVEQRHRHEQQTPNEQQFNEQNPTEQGGNASEQAREDKRNEPATAKDKTNASIKHVDITI